MKTIKKTVKNELKTVKKREQVTVLEGKANITNCITEPTCDGLEAQIVKSASHKCGMVEYTPKS